jgi:hypothetical protein
VSLSGGSALFIGCRSSWSARVGIFGGSLRELMIASD